MLNRWSFAEMHGLVQRGIIGGEMVFVAFLLLSLSGFEDT